MWIDGCYCRVGHDDNNGDDDDDDEICIRGCSTWLL